MFARSLGVEPCARLGIAWRQTAFEQRERGRVVAVDATLQPHDRGVVRGDGDGDGDCYGRL
ncbi:MAG TPA: hypothetical protein VIK70_07885 [Lysobacter sp.]